MTRIRASVKACYDHGMRKTLIEAAGWYGTIAIIGAYALATFGVLDSRSLDYILLNLTGAIGIVIVSFAKRAYQPGVLNVVWFLIAVIALARAF